MRFVLILALLLPSVARAHDGPPFPILIDEVVGPYKLSVWADPDVGTGTFWIYLDSEDEVDVVVCVQPTSGRLEEVCYPTRREVQRKRVQYYTEAEFDAQEMWRVRIKVSGPQGRGETTTEVEATPPGLGRWDLLVYLFPFLLLGGLWVYGVLRQRRRSSVTPGDE